MARQLKNQTIQAFENCSGTVFVVKMLSKIRRWMPGNCPWLTWRNQEKYAKTKIMKNPTSDFELCVSKTIPQTNSQRLRSSQKFRQYFAPAVNRQPWFPRGWTRRESKCMWDWVAPPNTGAPRNRKIARSRVSVDEIAWGSAYPERNRALSMIRTTQESSDPSISLKT